MSSEPIRIAQVLNRMDSGGIEQVVINYYRHIDRTKVQFDFLIDARSKNPHKEELEALGARFYLMPSYVKVFAYQKALQKVFAENKYRIVHVHQSTMSVFALRAAKKAGVPVRICHNHTTANWAEGFRTLLKYILRPFNKIYATDYFACGDYAARWMYGDKLVDEGKVYIMPNAIDAEQFRFSEENRKAVREEFGIPQDAFVVGHVGRFVKQKNHSFLIDVFAEVKKQRPDAVLLLVGEGPLMEKVKAKVEALGLTGSVIFAGARKDVHRFYSAMDVFCLPSLYEGVPVVAGEAVANGLQLVCTDYIDMYSGLDKICRLSENSKEAWIESVCQAKRAENVSQTLIDIVANSKELQSRYYELKM